MMAMFCNADTEKIIKELDAYTNTGLTPERVAEQAATAAGAAGGYAVQGGGYVFITRAEAECALERIKSNGH